MAKSQESKSRNPGAQPGNSNAVKHGAYAKRGIKLTKELKSSRDKARLARETHKRKALKEARMILKRAGLENDPMSILVARQIARLESLAAVLEAHHEVRGYFERGGVLRASVSKYIETVDRLLGEARRLINALGGGTQDTTLTQLIEKSIGDGPAIPVDKPHKLAVVDELLIPDQDPSDIFTNADDDHRDSESKPAARAAAKKDHARTDERLAALQRSVGARARGGSTPSTQPIPSKPKVHPDAWQTLSGNPDCDDD
jgi:hypothetical protein